MATKFSNWVRWVDRNTLKNIRYPGIYAVARSSRSMSGVQFSWQREIIYFGMSNARGGLQSRMRQFERTIQGGTGHGGAARVIFRHADYSALVSKLYVSVSAVRLFNTAWENAKPFSDGMAAVKVRNRWGFIDSQCKMRVPAKFDEVTPFENGVAMVAVRNPKEICGQYWGVIDCLGSWVVKPRFPVAERFSEGLAPVRVTKGKKEWAYGYINRTGAFAIKPQYGCARAFSEGLAWIWQPEPGDVQKYPSHMGVGCYGPDYPRTTWSGMSLDVDQTFVAYASLGPCEIESPRAKKKFEADLKRRHNREITVERWRSYPYH